MKSPSVCAMWLAILFCGCTPSQSAHSAEAKLVDDQILVQGELKAGDLKNFANATIKTIVFEKSLGGTYAGALEYIDFIEKKKLKTVAAGSCHSACALAFLAGENRSVKVGNHPILMVFHATRIEKNGVAVQGDFGKEVAEYISKKTLRKIDAPVLAMIEESWLAAAGVVFVFKPWFYFSKAEARYCDGAQGGDVTRCQLLPNADPYRMGIVNSR